MIEMPVLHPGDRVLVEVPFMSDGAASELMELLRASFPYVKFVPMLATDEGGWGAFRVVFIYRSRDPKISDFLPEELMEPQARFGVNPNWVPPTPEDLAKNLSHDWTPASP